MNNKALLLITLLIASGTALAEQDLMGAVGKQVLKDAATSELPAGTVEKVESTAETLETANKLKEGATSAPDALKGKTESIATQAAKQELSDAVPGQAKQDLKTVKKATKTAKKLKGKIPTSSSVASKTIKDKVEDKVKEEAINKAVDLVK